jgi:hypothetical protein
MNEKREVHVVIGESRASSCVIGAALVRNRNRYVLLHRPKTPINSEQGYDGYDGILCNWVEVQMKSNLL